MNNFKRAQITKLIRFSLYFAVFAFFLFFILQTLILTRSQVMLKDNNIIEWTEFLWLTLSAFFLFLAAGRTKEFPVLYTILALLPVIAAVRELDAVFDQIFHGAWVIPATAVYLTIFYKVYKAFNQLKDEVLRFVQTQQVVFLGIGLFVIVIFAQFSGRQILWHAVLGQNYLRIVGRLVEELIELLGYFILLIGSIECYLSEWLNHSA
jgi:hypothetical protein